MDISLKPSRVKSALIKPGLLFQHSAIMFFANVLGAFFSFAYHVFLARKLGPADYGAYGALYSILIFIFIITGAVQTTLARYIAEAEKEKAPGRINSILSRSFKQVLAGIIVIVVALILLASRISPLFQLEQVLPLAIIWVALVPAFLLSVLRGGLQGLQKYYHLGSVRLVEATSGPILGVILVIFGLGLSGAVTGAALGLTIATGAGLYFLRAFFRKADAGPIPGKPYRFFLETMALLIPITSMTTVDIILVKFYFPPAEAGQYIAAAYIGKILVMGAIAIATAMFPKTLATRGEAGEHHPLLRKGIVYMLILGAAFSTTSLLLGKPLIALFYGQEYGQTITLLPRLALALSFYGLGYIVAFYNLSRQRRFQWVWMTVVAIVQTLLIVAFHSSLETVANVMMGAMALFLILNWLFSRTRFQ